MGPASSKRRLDEAARTPPDRKPRDEKYFIVNRKGEFRPDANEMANNFAKKKKEAMVRGLLALGHSDAGSRLAELPRDVIFCISRILFALGTRRINSIFLNSR